jgi:hypothetical protein
MNGEPFFFAVSCSACLRRGTQSLWHANASRFSIIPFQFDRILFSLPASQLHYLTLG